MVRARKITDNMAIAAAESLAKYAEKRGMNKDNIIPKMDESAVFPEEAADVAMQAIKDGVARVKVTREEAFEIAKKDIDYARGLTHHLMDENYIEKVPQQLLDDALKAAVDAVK